MVSICWQNNASGCCALVNLKSFKIVNISKQVKMKTFTIPVQATTTDTHIEIKLCHLL